MLKIAQIQTNPALADCERNIEKINNLMLSAVDADLIILPELANSGYNFENFDHAMECATNSSCAKYVDYLREFSFQNNISIVSGFLEKDNKGLFNSSIFVSPDGSTGKYRKIHLFMNEKKIFLPGDIGLPVFSVGEYKLGMLICFDYLFPEIWRIMALKNADIIAHPSNLVTRNAHKVVPAQAVMNGYFVITTNRVGTDGNLSFCGDSFIANPRGEIISKLDRTKEDMRVVEIDPLLSRDKMITPKNHILADRITENYKELLEL